MIELVSTLDVKELNIKESDVKGIVSVIRDSIRTCVADHQNNPEAIEQWLANKTQSNIKQWMVNNITWIFRQEGQIKGVILVSPQGEILLNYVAPNSQGQGIGRALLNQVKQAYLNMGISTLTAESTLTAQAFYLANGFECTENIYEEVAESNEANNKGNQHLVAYKMQILL